MARSTLVMGNWKMNLSLQDARSLATALGTEPPEIPGGEVVVIPSPVHVAPVSAEVADSDLVLGAQDCVWQEPGAFTGGTSASQLAELGVRWVLVGHSERRAVFGETDGLLALKFAAVVDAGLRPVLCVGETLEEREAGQTADRVSEQLERALPEEPEPGFAVAYEPVWAIGTGHNAELGDVVDVHTLIRSVIAKRGGQELAARTPILYGGSVNDANAAAYLGHPEIDGALVGGASLDAAKFRRICSAGANRAI